MRRAISFLTLMLMLLSGCGVSGSIEEFPEGVGPIYPDYMDVTVPASIAPLNFCYTDAGPGTPVTTFSAGDCSLSVKGRTVQIPPKKWSRLMAAAKGGEVQVSSSAGGLSWKIYVSEDEIDYGLNYRKLAPGYEVYSKMGIYERNLSSFDEHPLIENTSFDGCVNCHAYNRCEPSDMSLHVRGDHGATLLRFGGRMQAYNTKTDSTLGFCVYPCWHPSGKYIAYSTNSTRQSFHAQRDKLIEVFDVDSDMLVYDIDAGRLLLAPHIMQKDVWETFPALSPDGETLYFCAASARQIPSEFEQIRYNLCKTSFASVKDGSAEAAVDTVVFAEGQGGSISFPKPSFDGKWLMYTLSDYGQFSIWHHEADLWVMNLSTGECRALDEANSSDTESYHNWSSNSRWFVFASRRDDGQYTRPYICHFSEDGVCGKPFMLPQKDPRKHYLEEMLSYNVPEFVSGPVDFDFTGASKLINSPERIDFGL